MRDWMGELRALPLRQIRIEHNPPSERYGRAFDKRLHILQSGHHIGTRSDMADGNPVEIAVWASPQSGKGCGFYACFRVWCLNDAIQLALLFCFYDGTEKSPCFKTFHSAREFALQNEFV